MNKNLFNFAKSINFDLPIMPSVEYKVSTHANNQEQIFQQVYAPDDVTGLPSGDLSLMLSDKVHPDIRQYIMDNLQHDISPLPPVDTDLSPDEIFAFSRQGRETREHYIERISEYVNGTKKLYDFVNSQKEPKKD